DGERLATASLDDTVRLWSAGDRPAALAIRPANSALHGLVFSPDGRHLAGASGRNPNNVAVLSTATAEEVRALKGHELPIAALAYAPDGKSLASLSLDNTVRLWDTGTGQTVRIFRLGGKPTGGVDFRALAYSPDGKRLAAAANSLTVKVWDLATGEEQYE